jgi:hypothetical protein
MRYLTAAAPTARKISMEASKPDALRPLAEPDDGGGAAASAWCWAADLAPRPREASGVSGRWNRRAEAAAWRALAALGECTRQGKKSITRESRAKMSN